MCFRPSSVSQKQNRCPNCKKVNSPDAKVCAFCGTKLEVPSTPPGQPGGIPKPPIGLPPKPPAKPSSEPSSKPTDEK